MGLFSWNMKGTAPGECVVAWCLCCCWGPCQALGYFWLGDCVRDVGGHLELQVQGTRNLTVWIEPVRHVRRTIGALLPRVRRALAILRTCCLPSLSLSLMAPADDGACIIGTSLAACFWIHTKAVEIDSQAAMLGEKEKRAPG